MRRYRRGRQRWLHRVRSLPRTRPSRAPQKGTYQDIGIPGIESQRNAQPRPGYRGTRRGGELEPRVCSGARASTTPGTAAPAGRPEGAPRTQARRRSSRRPRRVLRGRGLRQVAGLSAASTRSQARRMASPMARAIGGGSRNPSSAWCGSRRGGVRPLGMASSHRTPMPTTSGHEGEGARVRNRPPQAQGCPRTSRPDRTPVGPPEGGEPALPQPAPTAGAPRGTPSGRPTPLGSPPPPSARARPAVRRSAR